MSYKLITCNPRENRRPWRRTCSRRVSTRASRKATGICPNMMRKQMDQRSSLKLMIIRRTSGIVRILRWIACLWAHLMEGIKPMTIMQRGSCRMLARQLETWTLMKMNIMWNRMWRLFYHKLSTMVIREIGKLYRKTWGTQRLKSMRVIREVMESKGRGIIWEANTRN